MRNSLFSDRYDNPKRNAQDNLEGITHYVTDSSLRFHKSRILYGRPQCGGLIYALVTSDSADYQNTKREFRYVLFDLNGTVIDRPELGEGFTSKDKAKTAMFAALDKLDAKAITNAAIDRAQKIAAEEFDELRAKVAKVEA